MEEFKWIIVDGDLTDECIEQIDEIVEILKYSLMKSSIGFKMKLRVRIGELVK